jgi:hypothetical protein
MPGVSIVYQFFKVKASPPEFSAQQAACRQREYDECLYHNLKHEHVERIHILLENEVDEAELKAVMWRFNAYLNPWQKRKMVTVMLGRRMQYSDAFEYCNENLSASVSIVLNADIFLGEGVDLVLEQKDALLGHANAEVQSVLSLTRHEKSICGHRNQDESVKPSDGAPCGCPFMRGRHSYAGSHDSFWFVPPVSDTVVQKVQHIQNRWGAEHAVINALLASGYRLLNPSRTIRTYHNHSSDLHPWRQEPGGGNVLADPRDHIPLPPTTLS